MAPPPRRPRPPPLQPETTEPSLPAHQPEATDATDESPAHEPSGPGSTDELAPVPARRGKVPMRRTGRPPVRDAHRRIPTGRDAPKKRSVLVPVLLLAVLGIGGAVAWKKLQAPPPPPPDPRAKDLEAAKLAFQEGKNLVRKGQWKLAAQQFDQAAELSPDVEGLKPYLEAEKVEVPLQQHLDEAAAAIDQNQLARAARELAAVPESTQQLTRRTELVAKLNKAADQRLKDAAPLASNNSKMRELKALAEDVLAVRPQDRSALAYLDTANRILGWRPTPVAPPAPGDPAVEVIALWTGGDGTGAFAKAEACASVSQRCARLKEQIAQVTPLLKKLEALEENELLDAVRLDKVIGGGAQSASGKQAGVRLAAVLTPKASSAAARKQWGPAMAVARKILEGDPGNPAAKNIISDGRSAADELFHRCYVGRQSDPEAALPLCREVIEMLPDPNDELHKKAQRVLDANKPE